MLGLQKWKTTFMSLRLGDIWPWNLPNPIENDMLAHGGRH
jgi:hypothetical protein